MSSISKQASPKNGSFYVLQSPHGSEGEYHIGELILGEKDQSERAGFFTTYDQSSEQVLGPNRGILTSNELKSYLKARASSVELRLNPSFSGKQAYLETFEEIQREMKKGSLKKAVLFKTVLREEEDFLSKSDFMAFAMRLLSNQTGGYLFGYYNPEVRRAYLGVSPEFLCRQEDGQKYTTAVAGTKTESEDLNDWGAKLSAEHELVKCSVDEAYQVSWGETYTHEYGPLRHLKSEGLIKTEDSVAVVSQNLHPTSAVGALPRSLSLKFRFGDLSNKERGHFGGYALLEGVEDPFSLVTIRGLEWSNKSSFVCIGGGVLPESCFEDEWLELERKWKTFRGLWK